MALQTTGYNNQSANRYLLDAGAIYYNVTYDELTGGFEGELLGATSGGNEFSLTQETRVIEVDGVKGRTKGSTVISSEEPALTVNLKELTAKNLQMAIAGANIDETDENYDILTTKGKIELSDYLDNVCFVGRLSGSSKPVVIMINNALSVEGITISTTDNAEAVIPVRFVGHYDEGNIEAGTAPFKIWWPKESAV
jgi:hypothetical protein